jgi:hypothetical protein
MFQVAFRFKAAGGTQLSWTVDRDCWLRGQTGTVTNLVTTDPSATWSNFMTPTVNDVNFSEVCHSTVAASAAVFMMKLTKGNILYCNISSAGANAIICYFWELEDFRLHIGFS